MFKVPELWRAPDQIQDTQDLAPVFYDPASFEEFEAEFRTPEEQEQPAISVSMRMATVIGGAALVTVGVLGYEAGQPDGNQLEISAEQITEDLNSGDRTTEPVIIEQGSELIIPKETPDDAEMSVVNPIRLGDDKFGALIFNDDGTAKVVEVPSNGSLRALETNGKEAEANEIVYPVSVVYTEVPTEDGETERVYSGVAGDKSGNAANMVKIDTKQSTPDQKRLLQDKDLKKLVKDAVSLASQDPQDRVGYLDIAS